MDFGMEGRVAPLTATYGLAHAHLSRRGGRIEGDSIFCEVVFELAFVVVNELTWRVGRILVRLPQGME